MRGSGRPVMQGGFFCAYIYEWKLEQHCSCVIVRRRKLYILRKKISKTCK